MMGSLEEISTDINQLLKKVTLAKKGTSSLLAKDFMSGILEPVIGYIMNK